MGVMCENCDVVVSEQPPLGAAGSWAAYRVECGFGLDCPADILITPMCVPPSYGAAAGLPLISQYPAQFLGGQGDAGCGDIGLPYRRRLLRVADADHAVSVRRPFGLEASIIDVIIAEPDHAERVLRGAMTRPAVSTASRSSAVVAEMPCPAEAARRRHACRSARQGRRLRMFTHVIQEWRQAAL